jgi:hypothetical protein
VRICETCGCYHESGRGIAWTVEAAESSPFAHATTIRSRAPPDRTPHGEETEDQYGRRMVEECLDDAYRRRTASERAEFRARFSLYIQRDAG